MEMIYTYYNKISTHIMSGYLIKRYTGVFTHRRRVYAGLLRLSINLHGDLYRFICVLIGTYINDMYCNKTGCHGAVRVHLCSIGALHRGTT